MKRLIFLSILSLFSILVQAQTVAEKEYTATFEDGTKINYSVVSLSGDDLFKNCIAYYGMARDNGLVSDFYYSRFEKDKYYASATLGFNLIQRSIADFDVDGIYFLSNSTKNYKLPLGVKTTYSGSVETHYNIKTEAEKGRHFGVHAEIGYKKFGNDGVYKDYTNPENHILYNVNSLTSGVIGIGAGYVSTKYGLIHIKSDDAYGGGGRLFMATADLLVFPAQKVSYSYYDTTTQTNTVPVKGNDVPAGSVVQGKIGFRIMAQGQTTFQYHKHGKLPNAEFGFTWRLGFMKSESYTSGITLTDSGIAPIFGLGLFSFFGY